MVEKHQDYVTITHFIKNMLGFKARGTYYNHLDEPGWPQRVYPLGKPMLVYAECVAYLRKVEAAREAAAAPPPVKRRRPGRPVGAKTLRAAP